MAVYFQTREMWCTCKANYQPPPPPPPPPPPALPPPPLPEELPGGLEELAIADPKVLLRSLENAAKDPAVNADPVYQIGR